MTRPEAARSRPRLALMLALRHTPLPWNWKHRAIRLVLTKSILVSVGVIPDGRGRVLLLRTRYSGEWLLPGGALEAHEDPLRGLLRECREELNAAVTVERLSGVYTSRTSRETYFAFRCAPLTAPPVLSEEHEAWRYVPAERVRPGLRPIVEDALADAPAPAIRHL